MPTITGNRPARPTTVPLPCWTSVGAPMDAKISRPALLSVHSPILDSVSSNEA
ncbi:putative 3,4-dihydroxy-2-butanone kinase protein [Corchorus olitorius]|uniref:3,4-dihydroxy-2-butanone kinase protein n=1 Tax=Corchorus olitorius TaxID=93759 RepID=A0A1R3J1K2_9ROSI|nr:putative 3,4-dihydroxy-2-butanone kinase protein [Corchorus olitorius]